MGYMGTLAARLVKRKCLDGCRGGCRDADHAVGLPIIPCRCDCKRMRPLQKLLGILHSALLSGMEYIQDSHADFDAHSFLSALGLYTLNPERGYRRCVM